MKKIVLKAFAKINLCLDIVGVNSNGYHQLDTVMQSVSLYDTVTVSLNNSGKITVDCSDSSICGSNNIVYRAAELFLNKVKSNLGADIYIKKNIPLRSGLGGGSADAAAVINGLNILLSNPLTIDELCKIGVLLGADVPFCIVGSTKRCNGIGEVIYNISKFDFGYFVLLNCGKKESTKKMYSVIDSTQSLTRPNVDNLIKAIADKNYDGVKNNAVNVFSCCYNLTDVSRNAFLCGADAFCMSGSGSYGYCLLKNQSSAEECCSKLKKLGFSAFVAKPVSAGFEIISINE